MISVNPKVMASAGAHVRSLTTDTPSNRLGFQAKPLLDVSEAVQKALKGEFPEPLLRIPYVTEAERAQQHALGKGLQPAAAVDAFKANMPAKASVPTDEVAEPVPVLDIKV